MSDGRVGGFLIAAPHSGSGKTTITLGILRALRNRGVDCGPAKAGPDFIDPAFHAAASGRPCVNLDAWAMRKETLVGLAKAQQRQGLLIVEAMMGLFDGAADGTGSAADLAGQLHLPIVLVVDCASQSHSVAALVAGFRDFRTSINVAGVILNRIGSQRHEQMLREALAAIDMPVLGAVYRNEALQLPSRHLGLVQAGEHPQLETFLEAASKTVEEGVDLDLLQTLTVPQLSGTDFTSSMPPLGQRIAVAKDDAFRFCYEHILQSWRSQGSEIYFFSPLADEAPDENCNAIFLPGGYPELHAGKLSTNQKFISGLQNRADLGATIYGECGGYMVLGEGLIDADGCRHKMANLLPLCTSFEKRKLQLGYRVASCISNCALGEAGTQFTAHEFHYSTIVSDRESKEDAAPLFDVVDARGDRAEKVGMQRGNVMGSYMHIIDIRGQS